jgi:multiple sugar transport system substrate-binding protein
MSCRQTSVSGATLAWKDAPAETVHESGTPLRRTSRETLMTVHNDKTEYSIPQVRPRVSRRAFLRAAGASAGLALIAACSYSSGPSAPAAPSTPAAAGAPTAAPAAAASSGSGEVQFWDMVWGPPEYIDTGKKLVEQFNQQNSGIKASYQSTPWSSWPQVFTTAIGSGTAPDVSTGGGGQAVQYYPQGAILEVDDVIAGLKSAGKDKDFTPGTLDTTHYNDHYVALPWGMSIRLPYYRKDLFAKAGVQVPTNWDELRAALKKLTSGAQYGFVFAGGNPAGWQQMFALMFNNGGGFFTAEGKLDVMNPRNVEAFQFINDLIKDGSVHPGSAGFSDADMTKAFGSGGAAMTIFVPDTETRVDPTLKESIGLMPPLTGPHGDKGTIYFVNNIMMYKQTKNPDAAKTFLKWWSDNQKPLWTEGHVNQLPVRASIASDPYFQNSPNYKAMLDQWVPVAKLTTANVPGTMPALGELDSAGIFNTLATDIMQKGDVTAALQKCEASLKQLKSLTNA